ncbi:MAG: BrnT family toxin [Treponema sp.]|jgi:uncharacterized DUF497 family protein|nr:BrnT family toxin [Treponema sp.]
MEFVWDGKKNLDNIKKHGLGFVQVIPAFSDPLRKEYYDGKHSSLSEDRLLLVGSVENSILLISFTEPKPETIRIISARKATNHEVEVFQYGNG